MALRFDSRVPGRKRLNLKTCVKLGRKIDPEGWPMNKHLKSGLDRARGQRSRPSGLVPTHSQCVQNPAQASCPARRGRSHRVIKYDSKPIGPVYGPSRGATTSGADGHATFPRCNAGDPEFVRRRLRNPFPLCMPSQCRPLSGRPPGPRVESCDSRRPCTDKRSRGSSRYSLNVIFKECSNLPPSRA